MNNRNLRARIIERFGTQERFALRTGLNECQISKIVRRVRKPSEKQMQLFTDQLGLSREEVWPGLINLERK